MAVLACSMWDRVRVSGEDTFIDRNEPSVVTELILRACQTSLVRSEI